MNKRNIIIVALIGVLVAGSAYIFNLQRNTGALDTGDALAAAPAPAESITADDKAELAEAVAQNSTPGPGPGPDIPVDFALVSFAGPDGKQIGKITLDDGKMGFEGGVNESGAVFVANLIVNLWPKYRDAVCTPEQLAKAELGPSKTAENSPETPETVDNPASEPEITE